MDASAAAAIGAAAAGALRRSDDSRRHPVRHASARFHRLPPVRPGSELIARSGLSRSERVPGSRFPAQNDATGSDPALSGRRRTGTPKRARRAKATSSRSRERSWSWTDAGLRTTPRGQIGLERLVWDTETGSKGEGDLPRSLSVPGTPNSPSGLSPRWRGNPLTPQVRRHGVGQIPALAGEPTDRRRTGTIPA